MMSALYQKYRPQTFAEVVGQEAVVRTLSNALTTGSVRQAYLFAGPRGTGKTSLARILAKSVNCVAGPSATPDDTCPSCVAITNGSSLDVTELDAASQRGIDDVREIRERAMLAPFAARSKVYIFDEAHQLTDAAWNALLKLIEEPPPHLLFVFCTTELYKVLPTVRSRCQTFVFQRPRLPEIVRKLRLIADGEGIDVSDAALALIAKGGRGAFRDAESTLDQLATASGGRVEDREVLALLGAVEDEVLFRLLDHVVDGDAAGALVLLEELSEQGQDVSRVVSDLLEHLRHLMLVQHTGEVPETLPVTEEARERLREQANQLGAPSVVRLIDLLHLAVDDMRQGGDPRLLLELALVKVTRPGADLSLESLAYRMEQLERRGGPPATSVEPVPRATLATPAPAPAPASPAAAPAAEHAPAAETAAPAPPSLELGQLQEAWRHAVLPALERRSIPAAAMLVAARPAALEDGRLTLEFPTDAAFHREKAEEPRNAALLLDALYEVTGRRLELVFATGEPPAEAETAAEHPLGEAEIVELVKSTFDAQELDP
jgi:DNA polymerase-3 subunit gamma/tau